MRLALVCALCLAPAIAIAEEEEIEMEGDPPKDPVKGEKDPKAAAKWLQTGKTLVQKAEAAARAKKPDESKVQFENAITAYEKAIETGTDVNVIYELATVEEKAGKLDRAATHYRVYLKSQGARADLVKKSQARYDDLVSKTGLVVIVSKPEGATITINNIDHGKTPLADPLVLMPNKYTVTISADGYQPKDIEFEVEAGSESERTVELDKTIEKPIVKPRVDPVVREEPIDEVPVAGPSKLPLYVGAGATGGLLLIATITGITASSKHSTFEDDTASPLDRENARDSGKTLALVTDLCLVGALAAGGFTAYWYFAKYKPAQRKMETKTAVVPWVKPDAGGVSFAGSF